MAVTVGPTETNPTHDFSLSDGTNTLGFIVCNGRGERDVRAGFQQSPMPRTSLKMSQGQAKYEDFELPFTSIIQEDFSGGMLAEDFEDDRTKFRDARHCDTTRGDVVCGPEPTEISVITETTVGDTSKPSGDSVAETAYEMFACKYVADDDYSVSAIKSPGFTYFFDYDDIYVAIYDDSSGEPGSELASGVYYESGTGIYEVELDSTVNLSNGTTYWIVVYGKGTHSGTSTISFWAHSQSGIDIYAYDGASWGAYSGFDDYELAYELVAYVAPEKIKFFEHRRCLYAIVSYDDGSTAAKLFQNGYRGAATSNSADLTKLNTNLDLSVDMDGNALDLDGAIALIIEGPGSAEEQPCRRITGNTTTGTNDSITVESPWKIAHTTATSFVILGTDDWWEISSTGLGTKITDVCIVYDYVAIAQGDSDYIRKFRWYNNAGTGTNVFSDDGTNAFDLLLMVADTEGAMNLWAADIDDNTVDYAPAQYYATDHTFTNTDIKIGTSIYDDIKNLIAYGDPLIPYVIKENSFGSIENDIYAEVPIGELDEVRSEYNGIAVMKHGVYLYFNIGEMTERFYDRRLDDVGLTKGEGLPEGRRGIVRKFLSYPGRFYQLIYSEGNVPSIHCFNGYGWHEIWRPTSVTSDGSGDTGEDAPFAYNVLDQSGGRCTDMIVQVIPGETIDRLWFDHNGTLNYIPIAINPRQDSNYEYRDLSQFETAWIYGNLKDVEKYWHSIKLHTENLSGTDQSIKIEYKVDEDTSWTHVGVAETSPIQELDLSSSYNVTGHRIKFRFTLHTSDSSETPRILAYVVKGVIRIDAKKGYHVTVLTKNETDLTGADDSQTNIMSQLDTWSNSDNTAAPLTLRHNISYYDNKKVFIDPASLSFLRLELVPVRSSATREYAEIASFVMYEA